MSYIDMFGIEWPDDEASQVWVCLTHKRFVPCRRTSGICELSCDTTDAVYEQVRQWQADRD
ncbi:hypothetical protein E3G54_004473 [Mycobacteroides abscessus]|nr:hypothetical protein [Mycobacteroides abscessus]